ncbi:hypothetical protein EHS13_10640 [Paenibacillus psychroresistens]|uniref:Beta-galactosidase trimerisation domain-containing protein n=1 Tax=Paenibacillus psychroresistens TaxID=1778678 RepID=A0A6B8RGJ4_9BACL|nr:hypothetical protein [Paenibacillus psychroresistens]QGQ95310.1 hypothetical protein EHS13_10640 [Paenibacillus psychroresistens]
MSRRQKGSPEWTGFQESRPYGPKYDLRTDFVMVYGISEDLPDRINGWKQAGYTIHLMTGVSWGEYQDYLYGRFDGHEHWDEAQTDRKGNHMLHGKDIPYMVPTISFAEYLATHIKRAIDCGVEAIHMEEPEFWAATGYSDAFKREWINYYGEDWIPPHSSPDAQYRASKLKAMMYYRALDRICSQMKEYSLVTYGRTVRFYVPTHSLINYTQWRIISPEALLVSMPACDGFIAQIWTGTARTPNVYKGIRRERTFETAYLEYGIMQELTRGTGREMWFLHDPIEDNPGYSWSDYRKNYKATVVASLLHPEVSQYEVCPWPRRVFEGSYPNEDGNGKEKIPGDYATVLLTVMNVLRDLHNHEEENSDESYTTGIGLCLANSAMYQRGDVIAEGQTEGVEFKYDGTATSEELSAEQQELLDWSAFYGLALPLVKSGIPLRPLQFDNILTFPGYLDNYRVLLLSYEFMKPEHPGIHQVISQWVREGGVLIYVGDGSDPFHAVSEWWNSGSGKRIYDKPEEHLFEAMGIGRHPEEGEHQVGEGAVLLQRVNPTDLSRSSAGAKQVRESVQRALVIRGESDDYKESNLLKIKRGPYLIVHALDEIDTQRPVVLQGLYVDLFEADLPVRRTIELKPGEDCLLYDLNFTKQLDTSEIVVSSSRIRDELWEEGRFGFISESPANMTVSTLIRTLAKPLRITAGGEQVEFHHDPDSGTVLVRYPGIPDGIEIILKW